MAINRGPKLVTNGLVLALDPADRNSYSGVEVLIVAGGGSGGVDNGGGGGGGGVIYTGFSPVLNNAYSIVVGAGGAARLGTSDDGPGNNGGNSSAFGYTAIGGSGGTGWVNPALPPGSASYTGGSGGGQSASTGGVNGIGAGTGTAGQGNNGGTAVAAYAGGGGGAGGRGGNASSGNVGAGGEGLYVGGLFGSTIGVGGYVAGGGAGGFDAVSGYTSTMPFTRNGTIKKLTETGEDSCPANTGAGGNGANHDNENSGGGGSGVVLVRYYGPQRATGGTIYSFNGYTVHQFNSNGTFTLTSEVNWNDVSGSNNFIPSSNPTYAFNSFTLNGSNQFFYNTTSSSGFFISSTNNFYADVGYAWTISVWFKFPVTPANVRDGSNNGGNCSYCLFGNSGGIGGAETLALFVSGISGTFAGFHPYYCVVGLRGSKTQLSPNQVNTNTWNNVVVTWNGSAGRGYFNGVDRGALNVGANGMQVSGYTIGTTVGGNVGSHTYEGSISQVYVYNTALNATQVLQNFNATRTRFGV
jgi:hypothetical protein